MSASLPRHLAVRDATVALLTALLWAADFALRPTDGALPVAVGVLYVGVRGVLELTQCRSAEDVRQFAAGSWEGLRMAAERKPIRWRTVRALARAGRPPII